MIFLIMHLPTILSLVLPVIATPLLTLETSRNMAVHLMDRSIGVSRNTLAEQGTIRAVVKSSQRSPQNDDWKTPCPYPCPEQSWGTGPG